MFYRLNYFGFGDEKTLGEFIGFYSGYRCFRWSRKK